MNKYHSICVYGAFGAGKTAFLGELIQELLPPGTRARVITAEHYNTIQSLVYDKDTNPNGIIEVWKVNTRPHPFETMRFAVDGFWPENVNDPSSPLIAPTAETWAKYPIRVHEGMATVCQYLASNQVEGGLLDRAGKGDIIGPVQEHIQFQDGETGIGGMCWAHYNIGQRELVGLVQRSQKYPGYSIWSSHEDDGKERNSRIVGPEVIGSALTGSIGREFADLWRVAGVPFDYGEGADKRRFIERRLYVKEHFDQNGGGPYKAKNSAGLKNQGDVPDYIRLTSSDPEHFGEAREGFAKIIVEKLKL